MGDSIGAVRELVAAARASALVNQHFGRALAQYRAALRRLDALGGDVPADESAAVRSRALIGVAVCETERGADRDIVLRALFDAERWAHVSGRPGLVATVRANRGLLLLRGGDLMYARQELDAALDGDMEDTDRVMALLNRGTLHLETGEIDAAVEDFLEGRDLARADDVAVVGPMIEHNLGYALFLRGELPAALEAMEAAASLAPPEHQGIGLLDRAAVLYEAGLLTDAVSALERATRSLAAGRASRDLLDAELLRARCLLGLERLPETLELARLVARRARRMGVVTVALRAELLTLGAVLAITRRDDGGRARYAALARKFQALADRATGLEPHVHTQSVLLAGESWARAGREAEAVAAMERIPPDLRTMPLGIQVQAEVVRAVVAFHQGDRARGVRAVRRGQHLLTSQRARLGSVEAVTAAAVHGMRLGNVDVQAAFATGTPAAVFDAVERARAAFAGAGRVRPPDDPEAAELLSEARKVLERARLLGPSDDVAAERGRLHAQARALQARVRERAWRENGATTGAVPMTLAQARRAARSLEGGAILDLVSYRGRVMGVLVGAKGARLLDLADREEAEERARRARADLRLLSNDLIPAQFRAAASTSLARHLRWLDDFLLGPARCEGPLYLAVRHWLLDIPWAALPSRVGRPTTVNSWLTFGGTSHRASVPSAGVVVVAGPDLPHAAAEVEAVRATWDTATVLRGADATVERTKELLPYAGVVHLAAHGTHEADNPLFSSVRLADGPLFAHELDGADLAGAVVVLSACDVGSVTARPGGEVLGLTSVLLRLGAHGVISSVAPLRDDVAARVMPRLHAGLRDGAGPGAALATAIADEPDPVPLVCFGPLTV